MPAKMPNPNVTVIALTGTIGSGKSAVGKLLEEAGATVIDADALAREAVQPGAPALCEIEHRFGKAVLTPAGTLNRKALGERIFADSAERSALEDILHPRIRAMFRERITEIERSSNGGKEELVVYIVPLLFESRYSYDEFDGVLVVSANDETCISRIIERDRCDRQSAERRLKSQMPIQEKEARADYVIRNEGSFEDLRRETMAFLQRLRSKPFYSGCRKGKGGEKFK